MRIRTIKPEFWMHEGLCLCSDFTRLLAIALLNWSDDEGYFMANPILIRGQIFPFLDDSKIIPVSLHDLSRVGWIILGKDDQDRDVGFVVNFSKHQRVDKPKPSSIKGNFQFQDESKIDPRRFQDDSKEEGKGREGNKERNGTGNSFGDSEKLPFDSEDFNEAWNLWKKHRTEIKKKLTPTSVSAQLREFAAWGEARSIRAIYHTIKKGWQGLKEPEPRDLLTASPTFGEVESYAKANGEPIAAVEAFYDRMEKCGWFDRSGPVIDWKAAFRVSVTIWHEFNRDHQ